ncbi:hypothetical protein [Halomonas kalidii]|uniref:DUF3644 domain-containing protein n=1 Tax=Halomonas kalidii TaxID=3043293 RepID=A0ABT6VI39_9GAMM|nr:hypothetical protein [Halomonas kalidii]MDI5933635.1 hypothetical protein [Halomonas kalidii]
MSSLKFTNAQKACETILIEGKRYNKERGILRSENAVADRLLARRIELYDAYAELYKKLNPHPPALQVFLGMLLSTAAFWSREKIAEAREARNELVDVNRQIARKAEELADLMERRSDLHNTSGFSSNTHYHVCDVIEAASEDNYLFNSYVKQHLEAIRSQFDLKYWPSLGLLLRELAIDANDPGIEATDPLTAAATVAPRASGADFFKALLAAIEENSAKYYGQLPQGFKVTDSTLASLANCALGLEPDELVDNAYVKRFRQRERNGTSSHQLQ